MYYSMTFIDPTYYYGVMISDPSNAVISPYDLERARNTWEHWRVVPTSRPSFAPPSINTREVSVDGMNGVLDLSQALTGYPTYGNRTGSIEFAVLNDFRNWQEAYSDVLATLHGKRLFCVYEEDPEWYYVGRWEVQSWDTGKTRSTLTLGYNLEPYKYRLYDILGDWLWDPFNFHSGTITQRLLAANNTWNPYYHRVDLDLDGGVWDYVMYTGSSAFAGEDIEDSVGSGHYYKRDYITNTIGNMPTTLYLNISPDKDENDRYTEMRVMFYNSELNIGREDYYDTFNAPYAKLVPSYIISNFTGTNDIEIKVQGHGTVSVNFKPGRI